MRESRPVLVCTSLAGEFVLLHVCVGHRYVPIVLLILFACIIPITLGPTQLSKAWSMSLAKLKRK